jgi:hypothetical protein
MLTDSIAPPLSPAGLAPSSVTPITLEKFPRLPTELHLKVWKYATDGPHIIELDIYRIPDPKRPLKVPGSDWWKRSHGLKKTFGYTYKGTTQMAHFGVLGACRESREEFFKKDPDFIR